MPTYQYVCTECGQPLEAVQSFSDPALTTCPVCEGRLRKVYSAVGVVFKGSGFYRTDSRTSGSGKPASGKDKAAASADGGATSSSSSAAGASSAASSSGGSTSGGSSAGSSSSGSSSSGSSPAGGSSGSAT